MVANYGKGALGFDTDLFVVSSDFEKEMIVNDFGYASKNVFVTGLSRFDTLFMDDVKKKRQILIIPTWHKLGIVSDEDFFESEYYERYEQLINNQKLHKLASELGFKIIFCLHPNMQKFSRYFENSFVKVINQGEVDVQLLIKESALMITDYSSVGFDFSFLNKPVIYYQFDRSRFIGKNPSHLDLDNDLPGEICFEQDQILTLIQDYASNNFEMILRQHAAGAGLHARRLDPARPRPRPARDGGRRRDGDRRRLRRDHPAAGYISPLWAIRSARSRRCRATR